MLFSYQKFDKTYGVVIYIKNKGFTYRAEIGKLVTFRNPQSLGTSPNISGLSSQTFFSPKPILLAAITEKSPILQNWTTCLGQWYALNFQRQYSHLYRCNSMIAKIDIRHDTYTKLNLKVFPSIWTSSSLFQFVQLVTKRPEQNGLKNKCQLSINETNTESP